MCQGQQCSFSVPMYLSCHFFAPKLLALLIIDLPV